MKYFLDTANIEEIKKWKCFIEGVTTNPAILKKANTTVDQILSLTKPILGYKNVFIQLKDQEEFKRMTENAPFNPNIIFKVPLRRENYGMIKDMGNYKVCGTITYDIIQFNQACELGCNYCIVLCHKNYRNRHFLDECISIKEKFGFRTDIIAASFRSRQEIKYAIMSGANYAAVSPKIMQQCFQNASTERDYEEFYRGDENESDSSISDTGEIGLKAISK